MLTETTTTPATTETEFDFDMFGSTVKTQEERQEQERALEMFRVVSSRTLQVGNLRGVVR